MKFLSEASIRFQCTVWDAVWTRCRMPSVPQKVRDVALAWDVSASEVNLVTELPRKRLRQSGVNGPVREYFTPMLRQHICFIGW